MHKIDSLKQEARNTATWRGHTMSHYVTLQRGRQAVSHCLKCGAQVVVNTHPAPNDIDIGGRAVAVGCGES